LKCPEAPSTTDKLQAALKNSKQDPAGTGYINRGIALPFYAFLSPTFCDPSVLTSRFKTFGNIFLVPGITRRQCQAYASTFLAEQKAIRSVSCLCIAPFAGLLYLILFHILHHFTTFDILFISRIQYHSDLYLYFQTNVRNQTISLV